MAKYTIQLITYATNLHFISMQHIELFTTPFLVSNTFIQFLDLTNLKYAS